jgi:hypothetical protein
MPMPMRPRLGPSPSPQPPPLLDQLLAARRLVSDPQAWIPDHGTCFAQDRFGRRCGPRSSDAVTFTWRGALARECQALAQRSVAIDLMGAIGLDQLSSLGMESHAAVLDALDRAIERARAKDP